MILHEPHCDAETPVRCASTVDSQIDLFGARARGCFDRHAAINRTDPPLPDEYPNTASIIPRPRRPLSEILREQTGRLRGTSPRESGVVHAIVCLHGPAHLDRLSAGDLGCRQAREPGPRRGRGQPFLSWSVRPTRLDNDPRPGRAGAGCTRRVGYVAPLYVSARRGCHPYDHGGCVVVMAVACAPSGSRDAVSPTVPSSLSGNPQLGPSASYDATGSWHLVLREGPNGPVIDEFDLFLTQDAAGNLTFTGDIDDVWTFSTSRSGIGAHDSLRVLHLAHHPPELAVRDSHNRATLDTQTNTITVHAFRELRTTART